MGQEWIEIIKEGNIAYKEKRYSQASGLYTEVLAEAKRSLRQVEVLSVGNMKIVQEFCLCSRIAGRASWKNCQFASAERIYQAAAKTLKPFISNLNNRLPYRALIFTEYKIIFYELANFYLSCKQLDKLETYVNKDMPLLKKWARELQMMNKPDKELN